MELMRKLDACGEVTYVGNEGTSEKYPLRPLNYPPFEGRFFMSMKQVADKERFLVFTAEAASLIFGVKPSAGGPDNVSRLMPSSSNVKPLQFLITKGKMNGHPCVTIVTEDGRRGLRMACRHGNILGLMDLFFEDASKWAIKSDSDFENSTEILAIETNTFGQAISAFATYAPYIGILK